MSENTTINNIFNIKVYIAILLYC